MKLEINKIGNNRNQMILDKDGKFLILSNITDATLKELEKLIEDFIKENK